MSTKCYKIVKMLDKSACFRYTTEKFQKSNKSYNPAAYAVYQRGPAGKLSGTRDAPDGGPPPGPDFPKNDWR